MKRYTHGTSNLFPRFLLPVISQVDRLPCLTHDGEIHCLKPGGVAADARGAINTEIANLLAGVSEDDDEDAFAGLEEDEDELEENETVLDNC